MPDESYPKLILGLTLPWMPEVALNSVLPWILSPDFFFQFHSQDVAVDFQCLRCGRVGHRRAHMVG